MTTTTTTTTYIKSRWTNRYEQLQKSDTELAGNIRDYLQYLTLHHYAPGTILRHRYWLTRLWHWCSADQIETTAALSHDLLVRYVAGLVAERLSAHRRHDSISVVASFGRWLVKHGHRPDNPAQRLARPKLPRCLPRQVLSPPEIEAIVRQPSVATPLGLRDRAILETMYSTGIRRAEVVGLAVGDVDLDNGLVYVRRAKGNKQRLIPLGQRAGQWLGKYLREARPALAKASGDPALFLTYKGTGFTTSGLANLIAPYVRAAGQRGCCHLFRHAMATAMLANGADIRFIQEILGHEQLASTQIYTHVELSKLRQVYEQTQPAGQLAESEWPDRPAQPFPNWGGGQPFSKNPTARRPSPAAATPLAALVLQYLQAMQHQEFSEQTISKRRQHLRRFLAWCQERGIEQPAAISLGLLEHYHQHLARCDHQGQPLLASYLCRHLITLRMFCGWLSDHDHLAGNPALNLELPKRPKLIPADTLSGDELERVLSQPNTAELLGRRDRALLELLAATGIRRQELCALDVGDVNRHALTVHIRHGKGGSERLIPLSERAAGWLDHYLLDARPRLPNATSEPALFLGRYGSRLSQVMLAAVVKHYLRQAQITKPGSCHLFRHTLATQMLENGADIRYIQQMLGHRNLTSTQVYTKVSIRKLKEVHSRTHPASGHPPAP